MMPQPQPLTINKYVTISNASENVFLSQVSLLVSNFVILGEESLFLPFFKE